MCSCQTGLGLDLAVKKGRNTLCLWCLISINLKAVIPRQSKLTPRSSCSVFIQAALSHFILEGMKS